MERRVTGGSDESVRGVRRRTRGGGSSSLSSSCGVRHWSTTHTHTHTHSHLATHTAVGCVWLWVGVCSPRVHLHASRTLLASNVTGHLPSQTSAPDTPPDLYDRGRLHAPSRLGLELRVRVRVVVGICGYGYGSGQFRINVSSDRQTFAMVVCGERTGFRGAKVVHMVTKRSASEIWWVSHRSIILSSGTVGLYMSEIKSTIPSDRQRASEIYTAVMYSDRLNDAAVKYARLVNEGRDEVRTLHLDFMRLGEFCPLVIGNAHLTIL